MESNCCRNAIAKDITEYRTQLNLNMRAEKAIAMANTLPESIQRRVSVVTFATPNWYMDSNTTREGCRRSSG